MIQKSSFDHKMKGMKIDKKAGIFMDHETALFIKFPIDETSNYVIASAFTKSDKEDSLHKSEHLMHNKEHHQQNEYFEKIGNEIRKYNNVILFGPTNAKNQLHNLLKKDHLFADIKIEVQQTDKLTINQKIAFVKEYFITQL